MSGIILQKHDIIVQEFILVLELLAYIFTFIDFSPRQCIPYGLMGMM